jgi:drug/metabolite transporter (DMT)-like permease
MPDMKRICIGAALGFATGIAVVRLLEYGSETSDGFSLISAFVLFPLIFLAGLPWNLMIGEQGKEIVAIGGVGIGVIINSMIIGAFILSTRRPKGKVLPDRASGVREVD